MSNNLPDTPKLEIELNAGEDSDASELKELTSVLQKQLTKLDEVEEANLKTGANVPEHAKPVEWIAIGTLVVTLVKGGALTGLGAILGQWLSRDSKRSISLKFGNKTLDAKGLPPEEQKEVIKTFLKEVEKTNK
jgi:hypothetical protein